MSSASRLDLPMRRRTYKFALTPLADAMFQLLIFFMLSSSLIPYSLLTLQSAAPAGEETSAAGDTAEPAPEQEAAAPPADTAMWTIDNHTVIVGGQSFDFEDLGNLAAALGTPSAPANVILVVRASAQMQDITTVLEALQKASVGSVQITSGTN